jgi:inorganic pyrophosphatase
MIQHAWHEAPHRYQPSERTLDGVVEIPKGSKAKYEIDKATGLLRLDRVIFAAFVYPINYGFIPQTLGEDGDPLDILILSQVAIQPLCLVHCKIIGYMEMIDGGLRDEKIIAVPLEDASSSHLNDIKDLPMDLKMELEHFFTQYKVLRNKQVTIDQFKSAAEASTIVQESIDRYKQKFSK